MPNPPEYVYIEKKPGQLHAKLYWEPVPGAQGYVIEKRAVGPGEKKRFERVHKGACERDTRPGLSWHDTDRTGGFTARASGNWSVNAGRSGTDWLCYEDTDFEEHEEIAEYLLRTYDGSGESDWISTGEIPLIDPVISPPLEIHVEYRPGDTVAKVCWPMIPAAQGYIVERRFKGGRQPNRIKEMYRAPSVINNRKEPCWCDFDQWGFHIAGAKGKGRTWKDIPQTKVAEPTHVYYEEHVVPEDAELTEFRVTSFNGRQRSPFASSGDFSLSEKVLPAPRHFQIVQPPNGRSGHIYWSGVPGAQGYHLERRYSGRTGKARFQHLYTGPCVYEGLDGVPWCDISEGRTAFAPNQGENHTWFDWSNLFQKKYEIATHFWFPEDEIPEFAEVAEYRITAYNGRLRSAQVSSGEIPLLYHAALQGKVLAEANRAGDTVVIGLGAELVRKYPYGIRLLFDGSLLQCKGAEGGTILSQGGDSGGYTFYPAQVPEAKAYIGPVALIKFTALAAGTSEVKMKAV